MKKSDALDFESVKNVHSLATAEFQTESNLLTEANAQHVASAAPWDDNGKIPTSLVTILSWKVQVAQLSQRDRAAGWVSNGQKWKTGTERQYLRTI